MAHPHASLFTMVRRALRLRCVRCGGGPVLRSWFRMRDECPTCALSLERGEREDYWLGAYMLNLVAAELVAVGIGIAIIVGTWPDVPWTAVWVLSIALAVLSPLALFPFSRTLWLAGDLHFRPHEPGDMPDEHYRPVRPPRQGLPRGGAGGS